MFKENAAGAAVGHVMPSSRGICPARFACAGGNFEERTDADGGITTAQ